MTAQKNRRGQRGFSLVELLIVTVVFGIIIAGTMGFMTSQHRAFSRGADQMSALQNLRFAHQTLAIDLSTLGNNVPVGQPELVFAGDDVIAFTGDYASNLANDISAAYIDRDALSGQVQAPLSSISIPNTSYSTELTKRPSS